MRRIFYFVATNIAVLFILSIAMKVLGLEPYLNQGGLNYQSLLVFAAILGMGGSFISLLMSKWSAKRMMGAQVIEQPANATERWLVETVQRQAREAGIGIPEVAIYNASHVNAFATGAKRNDALVAVSSGLLQAMSQEEAEAVLGHEISHVANGDMVTLTLIQGILNTFVFFFSRVIGQIIDRAVFRSEHGHGPGFWITSIVAQLVLGILASMIVMWFSRQREFRADSGGARLAGREKMIKALERLKQAHEAPEMPEQLEAFGVSGRVGAGLKRLFMSHPPLDERIAALRRGG